MKIMVILSIVMAVLLVASVTALVTKYTWVSDAEELDEPIASCPSSACTAGSTYCYTNTQGGHSCTCQNAGVWGPLVHCSDFNQACSLEGLAGRCV